MACLHVGSVPLHAPLQSEPVFREDCTLCHDSVDDETGLDVCLSCFNGGCCGSNRHGRSHSATSKHPLAVNIRRERKQRAPSTSVPAPTTLAIAAESDADRYDIKVSVRCYECGIDDVSIDQGNLSEVVDGVLKANTFSQQEEIKAWQQDINPCEHTLCLEQESTIPNDPSSNLGCCSMCDLKENLWICLACGALGCGRAQWGMAGGNSHALAHSEQFSHPVAVKLGSLSAEGTADVYCYRCDEERSDPYLSQHLSRWGINIQDREKTEKTMAELQIEQNMKWEFAMTDANGLQLHPLFGPGLTGLKNLGNTCYINSCLQVLFSIPEFQSRYSLPVSYSSRPAQDFETQMRRLADGLLSGRYSNPSSVQPAESSSGEGEGGEVVWQQGISPVTLKSIVGKDHEEFSTMKQQDAFEFLTHLLDFISKSQRPESPPNPVDTFKFGMEQRLECQSCHKVRYTTVVHESLQLFVPIRKIARPEGSEGPDEFEPVTLAECLDVSTASERVDLPCPGCKSTAGFTKQSLFKTFPTVLILHARRFELVNWVPTKRDVPVIVNGGNINLDRYMSRGLQASEQLLPDDSSPSSKQSSFVPNAQAMDQLLMMGFPSSRCKKALKATGNSNADTALDYLLSTTDDGGDEDEDEDEGPQLPSVSQQDVDTLLTFGFTEAQARAGLKEANGNIERAVDWIVSNPAPAPAPERISTQPTSGQLENTVELPGRSQGPMNFELDGIICHKGNSIHAGHYVAFAKKETSSSAGSDRPWVLFNDEKVARAVDAEEMKQFAYVYFLRLSGASR